MTDDRFDICVIGAGSGGLVTAYAASHMGRKVALIEGHRMGGDCLNFGCVPSKALLAAGKVAHTMRHAERFGIAPVEPEVDFAAVNRHVREIIATIEPNDSVERYESFGVDVIIDHARFVSPDTVEVGARRIRARRFVIATGSRAAIPPITGLDAVPHFTNETLFDNTGLPEHLLVIGGGPIGSEMAQAHRRLGSRVTVLDMGPVLPHDDPELVAVVKESMVTDGIDLIERIAVREVSGEAGRISISFEKEGEKNVVEGTHLLVAAGRRPNIETLGTRGGWHRERQARHQGGSSSAHHEQARLRHRRLCGRFPVHPPGELPRGHRDQERPAQASGACEPEGLSLGDLYRSGTGACRHERGGGAQTARYRNRSEIPLRRE